MRSYLKTHIVIAVGALLVALTILAATWYVHTSLADITKRIESRVGELEVTLTDLATLTDRNGADEVTEHIIADCPRRAEFENALETLDTASQKELLTVQQLFESCGSYFAERKALMVARLSREYESLEAHIALLATIRDLSPHEKSLNRWKTLIDLESKRSSLLSEQTDIQGAIIRALIEGGRSQSKITDLIREAQNVSESLIITDKQIDELRDALVS